MPTKTVVTKTAVIENMAEQAGISKAAAGRALQALIDQTSSTLKDGGSLQIMGFGSFTTRKRDARKGTNPRTGEKLTIAARNAPVFTAGSALKNAVN